MVKRLLTHTTPALFARRLVIFEVKFEMKTRSQKPEAESRKPEAKTIWHYRHVAIWSEAGSWKQESKSRNHMVRSRKPEEETSWYHMVRSRKQKARNRKQEYHKID